MSDQIDISEDGGSWDLAMLSDLAQNAIDHIREELSLPHPVELSILACNDARIAALNTEFRGKPTQTNVLSWPNADEPDLTKDPFLGDIAIAYETCLRETDAQKKSAQDHTQHLILHAILHLMGYDHEDDTEAEEMEALETKLLAKMGIDDPYKDSISL